VSMWQWQGPSLALALNGHTAGITALALASDASLLLSGAADGELRGWVPATGTPRGVWRGHSAAVWALAFNATGQLAFSASADKTVRVWRTADGICAAVLQGHAKDVLHLSVALPTVLVSAASDGVLHVWDVSFKSGSMLSEPTPKASQQAHSGRAVRSLVGNTKRLPGILFSTGGDGAVHAWRCGQRSKDAPLECLPMAELRQAGGAEGTALALHCTSDAQPVMTLYASRSDGTVTSWRLHTSRGLAALTCSPLSVLEAGAVNLHALALSKDGMLLFGARADGAVCMWRARPEAGGGAHTAQLGVLLEPSHQGPVRVVLLSPDGRWLYSAGLDGVVLQWDTATGTCFSTLDGGHVGAIAAACLSKTGAALFTGSADRSVGVWQVAAPEQAGAQVLLGGRTCLDDGVAQRLVATGKEAHNRVTTRLTTAFQVMTQQPSASLWTRLSALLARRPPKDEPAAPPLQEHENDVHDWHPKSAP
jgi:WD40 repeat protein